MTKHRTITLTDRRPVQIDEQEWPVIARADGSSFGDGDPSRYEQARHRGEIDEYIMIVRQHADGRALVYAVVSAAISAWSQPAGGVDYRGGELLEPGEDLVEAIRRVGQAAATESVMPTHMIRECIADLPAETI